MDNQKRKEIIEKENKKCGLQKFMANVAAGATTGAGKPFDYVTL